VEGGRLKVEARRLGCQGEPVEPGVVNSERW